MSRRRKRTQAPESGQRVTAVALVKDGGGHRLVVLDLPADLALEHATEITEPDLLAVQLDAAGSALRDAEGPL